MDADLLRSFSTVVKAAESWTPERIHRIADQRGISWDNDPQFMALSKKVTGTKHLDQMSPTQLRSVAQALMGKTAGHVEDRIEMRTPGALPEVNHIRESIPSMGLEPGKTYHVPLRGDYGGYAVIGPAGRGHVVKTVLSPMMRPPGQRIELPQAPTQAPTQVPTGRTPWSTRKKLLVGGGATAAALAGGGLLVHRKLGMAATDISAKGLQKGDIILTTMGRPTYLGKKDAPLSQKVKERAYRTMSPMLQGGYTHAAVYVGNNQIVEARGDGVQKRTLKAGLKKIDGAVVVRPNVSAAVRRGAAEFAKSRIGRPYESEAFLGSQGVALMLPQKASKLFSRKSGVEDALRFTCSNLAAASYISQGHTPRSKSEWSMTVPADFLNPQKNKLVKTLGEERSDVPQIGRLRGTDWRKMKTAGMAFLKQDRPAKVKKIYAALKRDHPEMSAEMKARIAARQGKPGKQRQGPPYKGPIGESR